VQGWWNPSEACSVLRDMWRSVLLGVVLAGLLAGCSLGGGSEAGSGAPTTGVVQGRVVTTVCGVIRMPGGCMYPYRGSLVFCSKMGQIGVCPSARVDASGHYRIRLPRGRHALIPAPGSGNVVSVKPRWVSVVGGQTQTLNINGGNLQAATAQ
jgi:hypothetical protein